MPGRSREDIILGRINQIQASSISFGGKIVKPSKFIDGMIRLANKKAKDKKKHGNVD